MNDFPPPLDLDVVPTPGLSGRLALTAVPRDASALRALRARQTDVLVTLLPDDELARLGMRDFPHGVRAAGIEHRTLPISDMGIPASLEALRDLLRGIQADLAQGRNVVIHCRAGLGRSGLAAACLLVAQGMESETAIAHVRAHRPGAIETPAQEAFVRTFASE
jgi:protein-tyrosine phosphatase